MSQHVCLVMSVNVNAYHKRYTKYMYINSQAIQKPEKYKKIKGNKITKVDNSLDNGDMGFMSHAL